MKFFKNKKGFTLVELVVVIAILGILAGIAVPRFMDATATARGAKVVADLRTIDSAATMYYAKEGTYPLNVAAMKPGYLAEEPIAPTGAIKFPNGDEVKNNQTTAYGYTQAAGRATFTAGGSAKTADVLSKGSAS